MLAKVLYFSSPVEFYFNAGRKTAFHQSVARKLPSVFTNSPFVREVSQPFLVCRYSLLHCNAKVAAFLSDDIWPFVCPGKLLGSRYFLGVHLFHRPSFQDLGVNKLLESLLFGKLTTPREISTSSKSGSFFFMSVDRRLIVKTVRWFEAQKLLQALPRYLAHFQRAPRSLLTQFCGVFENPKDHLWFVIMKNLIPPAQASVRGPPASERLPHLRTQIQSLRFFVDPAWLPSPVPPM